MSAGPLTVPWLAKNVPAMLQAWWPGEEGGHAIADVLFGDVNPAGRLPHTVYASEAQVPPLDEYDITKGFTYMYLKGEPLFPFGHGLSYTTFKYGGLKLSANQIKADGAVNVSVDVTNTGKRAGDEVAQLYVHQEKSAVKVPVKELRGFQRISLQPGETRTVHFTLPAAKLAIWDVPDTWLRGSTRCVRRDGGRIFRRHSFERSTDRSAVIKPGLFKPVNFRSQWEHRRNY